MSPLASLAQFDFSTGMWRATARHLIPPDGAFDLPNSLLDDDGSAYRRGGSEFLSTSGLGSAGLLSVWDGFLVPGNRTFISNANDFGTLDGTEAVVNLGNTPPNGPVKPVVNGGVLWADRAAWGGSRKTAAYSAGTVAVTNGSATVTGTSTVWTANADAGMLFQRGSEFRSYVVKSIDSDTSLTLAGPYQGVTGSGASYTLHHLQDFPAEAGTKWAVAADRLFSLRGRRATFFDPGDPWAQSGGLTDFHELEQGAEIVGGAGLGDRLLIGATNGVWMVSNLAYDLTDAFGNPQHRVEHVQPDLILWTHEGIATYKGALVMPCVDHVWLTDGIGNPVPLTHSIAALYRSYVASGYKPGAGTVFRSHFFLPILDAGNGPIDLLVCRLDRPTAGPLGTVFPWTRWRDFTSQVSALAIRAGGVASARNPFLLAASLASSSRVLKLNSCFGPDVGQENEPDGTTHTWSVITRDYATGNGRNENTVRRVRLRYELFDVLEGPKAFTVAAATDLLTVTGHGYRDGDRVVLTALTGGAGLSTGVGYFVRDATTNTFKLATVQGGAAINVTSDGSGTVIADEAPVIAADFSQGQVDLAGVSLWDTVTWTDSGGSGGTGVWAGDDAGEWEGLSGVAPEDDGRDSFDWTAVGKNAFARFVRFRFRSARASRKLVLRTVEVFVRESGKD